MAFTQSPCWKDGGFVRELRKLDHIQRLAVPEGKISDPTNTMP